LKDLVEKEGHRSFSPSMNFPEKQPSFESYTSYVFEEVGAVRNYSPLI